MAILKRQTHQVRGIFMSKQIYNTVVKDDYAIIAEKLCTKCRLQILIRNARFDSFCKLIIRKTAIIKVAIIYVKNSKIEAAKKSGTLSGRKMLL